jgi:hypothetical protein
MADIIDLLWLILISIVTFMLYRIHKDKRVFENFENSSDISANVIKIYYDTLKRSPTSQELQKHTKEIFEKNYDYNELELRLVNSDEYQRLVKTQTDTILPETSRVLEEKQVVDRIKRIYLKVREKECPVTMYLPLKDMYIYFDYNVYKFVALLRDTKYSDFQRDILQISNLSRDKLIEMYLETFDDSKLNYDAAAIQEMDKSLPAGSRMLDILESDEAPSADTSGKMNAMTLLSYLMKNIKDDEARKKKLEEEDQIRKMREAAAELERQRLLNIKSTNDNSCDAKQRVYLPNESKILNTEHGFRVIQNLPPICVPIGKPNEVKEIIMGGALQGTSLDDAQDTQVGSIMPKFEFRRYIEIDTPGTYTKPTGQ